MTEHAFWQTKTLDQMSDSEWEALCDGCGQCCLHKLIDADTDELYYTNVACDQLDLQSCQCRNYENRFEFEPDCIKLTRDNMHSFEWLPVTCAYRLIDEGKPLPKWHPLVSGNRETMHKAGVSVRDQCVYEIDVVDWEEHIMNKPKHVR